MAALGELHANLGCRIRDDSGYVRLSDELTRDIAEWNALWDANFDPFDGWKSDAARERWRKDGADVVARLRAEVADFADFADVKYEPWPLGSREKERR
ncbi:hypothetical protein PU630_09865 [Microbacterium horticulturae]|uniref:Uncharacterized protein n=1 Tax=Microbacterium horticulturae TaxID=3028316 RepID=A0ABY8BTS8_9MICO|nr:hypothetical protein [Microbacterium sp. KACC 23027]WEG07566.1 hypothetical protein PU630_09865 [Microbacterium sp. KACC 23027]